MMNDNTPNEEPTNNEILNAINKFSTDMDGRLDRRMNGSIMWTDGLIV